MDVQSSIVMSSVIKSCLKGIFTRSQSASGNLGFREELLLLDAVDFDAASCNLFFGEELLSLDAVAFDAASGNLLFREELLSPDAVAFDAISNDMPCEAARTS